MTDKDPWDVLAASLPRRCVRDGYEWVTDNSVLAWRATELLPSADDDNLPVTTAWMSHDVASLSDPLPVVVAPVPGTCPVCIGSGLERVICDECGGFGQCVCPCGHEHDCSDCEGTGKTGESSDIPCPECTGSGRAFHRLDCTFVGGLRISDKYLSLLVEIGAEIRTAHVPAIPASRVLIFAAGTINGIVMPMAHGPAKAAVIAEACNARG